MIHLLVTVRWLDDRYHGVLGSEGGPEWPPSPYRLFQALVSAVARRGELDSPLGQSLAWLQRKEAPTIIAPRSQVGQVVTHFVPNNDGDKKPDRHHRLKGKVFRPTIMLGTPVVHYAWTLDQVDEPLAKHVCRLARYLTCLGWGIDVAFAEGRVLASAAIDGLAGIRWMPRKRGTIRSTELRVPNENTLNELTRVHQSALGRISQEEPLNTVDKPRLFTQVFYESADYSAPRPFAAFRLLHPEEDRFAAFPALDANPVAAMTRHAVASVAPADWLDSYVHGHRAPGDETQPRFSYLPLPSIERRGERNHTLGAIRRVLVAELNDGPESRLPWAKQRLPGQFLVGEVSKSRQAMLVPLNESDWVLRQYTDESDSWATVTPVVLPGSDDGKFDKAEKLFFKALSHAGYSSDALAELEFRTASCWPGGDLSLRYSRPDYLRKNHWSVHHMRIRWKRQIKGPIALGAGRHCGLGVFATIE